MRDSLSLAYAELLARVELFRQLDRVALARLAAYLEPMDFQDGAVVVQQGEVGDSLFVVARGTFGVFAESPDGLGETHLADLGRGDFFGEIALLTDEPRSATVRAIGSGQVVRLERGRFVELLRQVPAIALAIAAAQSRRLAAADANVLKTNQVIALSAEYTLDRMDPNRRRRVVEVSLLDRITAPGLKALFGAEAPKVAEDLASLGIVVGQSSTPLLSLLRERYELEIGSEALTLKANELAAKLAANEDWEEALGVLLRYAQPPEFAAMLGRALRGASPLNAERALRWVERIDDESAAHDAELALLRSSWHERRTERVAAERLLRRALSNAVASGDAEGSRKLSIELSRFNAESATIPAEGAHRLWIDRFHIAGLRLRALLALNVAAGFVVAALFVGMGQPQIVFGLLLGAAVTFWMSGIIPEFAVGLGLIAAWVLSGLVRPIDAAVGFGSMNWVFIVCVFGMAAATARSGLLLRVGLILVRRLPNGLFWQAGTLLLTGLLLMPLLPLSNARMALTGPIALAVAEALRLRDREPAAAVLGLATWIGTGPLIFMFLNGSSTCIIAWGILPEATREKFNWLYWFIAAAPFGLVVAVGSLLALFIVLRPNMNTSFSRQMVGVQLAVLGPVSGREVAMMFVLGFTVVGWVVAPMIGIDVRVVAVVGLIISVFTGSFDRRSLQDLDWNYLIFNGVVLSISELTETMGLDRQIEAAVGTQLSFLGEQKMLFLFGVAIVTLFVRFILESNQAVLILGLVLLPTAPSLGIDPWIIMVTVLSMCTMWFIPAQTSSYLVAYSTSEGRLYSQSQAERIAFAYVAVTLAGLAVSIPYWHLLGLL
ncbi:MAG: cyclic nucleotide-binding domain-containing protein [Chloroflexi bacterium]|nr:cyclic nucleotide-binding domain-containing protein [Chloroflexota bacterium]